MQYYCYLVCQRVTAKLYSRAQFARVTGEIVKINFAVSGAQIENSIQTYIFPQNMFMRSHCHTYLCILSKLEALSNLFLCTCMSCGRSMNFKFSFILPQNSNDIIQEQTRLHFILLYCISLNINNNLHRLVGVWSPTTLILYVHSNDKSRRCSHYIVSVLRDICIVLVTRANWNLMQKFYTYSVTHLKVLYPSTTSVTGCMPIIIGLPVSVNLYPLNILAEVMREIFYWCC